MAKHRTVYTYSHAGQRCRIEHAISADAGRGHSDAANTFHQALVERAQPKRAGLWQMANSGSAGGGVDYRGMESTYFAEWVQVDGGVRATINHNDQDGERVGLVLTRDERGYGWHTASGEDCGLGGFESVEAADDAAQQSWGAEVWGLRWCFEDTSILSIFLQGMVEFETGTETIRAMLEGANLGIYALEDGAFIRQGTIRMPDCLSPRAIHAAWMFRR